MGARVASQGIEPLRYTTLEGRGVPPRFSCSTGEESAPCPLRTCWYRDCRGLADVGELLLGNRGEDVETDLDLGGTVAGDVAFGAGDPKGLAGGGHLPTVGEVDFDGELVAVAGELDVFHDGLSFVRCGDCLAAFIVSSQS